MPPVRFRSTERAPGLDTVNDALELRLGAEVAMDDGEHTFDRRPWRRSDRRSRRRRGVSSLWRSGDQEDEEPDEEGEPDPGDRSQESGTRRWRSAILCRSHVAVPPLLPAKRPVSDRDAQLSRSAAMLARPDWARPSSTGTRMAWRSGGSIGGDHHCRDPLRHRGHLCVHGVPGDPSGGSSAPGSGASPGSSSSSSPAAAAPPASPRSRSSSVGRGSMNHAAGRR